MCVNHTDTKKSIDAVQIGLEVYVRMCTVWSCSRQFMSALHVGKCMSM